MKQRILAYLAVLLLLPGLAQAKIFLVDTDDTLRVVTASGVSTIHMYAAWADITTTALTPGASDAQVTTATTTVLVAAPGASTQRQIKGLSIRNSHASSSNLITVQFYDGATATELIAYTLLAGETLQWGEDENFRVIDASGQVKGSIVGVITDGTGDTTQANVSGGRLQVENYNANLAADNSTNSTSKVPVLAGVATTAAPTYTTTNQVPLSLQTDGSVRAAVTSSALPTGAATAANQDGIIKDGTGDTTQANVSSGALHVAQQGTVTVTATNLDVQIGGSDSLTIGTFPDNEPFNVAQINGATAVIATNALNTTGSGLLASALVGQCDDTTPTALTENSFGHARINCTTHQTLIEVGTALPTGTNSIGQVTANAGTNLNTSALALETSVDGLEGGLGAAADAAATAGSTGSLNAKQRLMTSQLDSIKTAVETLDNAISGSGINVTQINGTNVTMGNGISGTGVQRVTLASDSTGQVTANAGTNLNTSALLTTTNFIDAFGTAGTADTQVMSVQGIASMTPLLVNPGTAANMGVYVEDVGETVGGNLAMAGSVRRDTAAPSAGTTGDNATINTDALGLLWARNLDPCSGVAKTYLPISISTATTTEITPSLAGASTHYYVCSINLVTAAANNVLVADDDSDGCGSPTSGIFGSDGTPAAAEGWNFAANGGIVLGSGSSSIGRTGGTNRVICIMTSAATQLSGMMVVVAAP